MSWLVNVILAAAMLLFPAPAPRSLVAIGDSVTEGGWSEILAAIDPSITTRDAGIGGNTTAQMLARFETDVLVHHPAIIVVMGGTNDVGQAGYSESATLANLRAMVEQGKDAGARVILMTIVPNNDPARLVHTRSLNAAIRELAASEDATLVDVYPLLAGPDGLYGQGLTADGTHPGLGGEIAIAEAVHAAL